MLGPSYQQQVTHGLGKTHNMHGHSHGIGEGKEKPDRSSQLRTQAA